HIRIRIPVRSIQLRIPKLEFRKRKQVKALDIHRGILDPRPVQNGRGKIIRELRTLQPHKTDILYPPAARLVIVEIRSGAISQPGIEDMLARIRNRPPVRSLRKQVALLGRKWTHGIARNIPVAIRHTLEYHRQIETRKSRIETQTINRTRNITPADIPHIMIIDLPVAIEIL